MKMSDAMICWTPNRPEYASGMRGKARIFAAVAAGVDEMTPFPRRAGRTDARAHDPRPEVRQTYALMLAFVMSERDGLDPATVHQTMLAIDEYRDGCAQELLQADNPSIKTLGE